MSNRKKKIKEVEAIMNSRNIPVAANDFAKQASQGRTNKLKELQEPEVDSVLQLLKTYVKSDLLLSLYGVAHDFSVLPDASASPSNDALLIDWFKVQKLVDEEGILNTAEHVCSTIQTEKLTTPFAYLSWPTLYVLCTFAGNHFAKQSAILN